MTRKNLKDLTISELVEQFAAVAIDQDRALLEDELSKYKRLYWQMDAIAEELKARPGDQRRALLSLFSHPNLQVKLSAAKDTLAIAPDAARKMLQQIEEWGRMPQAGDAGMCLWALDEGIFKPK